MAVTTFRLTTPDETQTIWLREPGEYRIELAAERVEVEIKGAFQVKASEIVEVKVDIVHMARSTTSRTLLRGVAQDSSQLYLSGTIIVEPKAQLTNAFLTENILLLSPTARAQALPNLEIEANEVKCSHAATVSNIPQEQLFYLRSRGLDLEEAKRLVVEGFLNI
jgi:Fe-S cluster assembly scaffold protein SufB